MYEIKFDLKFMWKAVLIAPNSGSDMGKQVHSNTLDQVRELPEFEQTSGSTWQNRQFCAGPGSRRRRWCWRTLAHPSSFLLMDNLIYINLFSPFLHYNTISDLTWHQHLKISRGAENSIFIAISLRGTRTIFV